MCFDSGYYEFLSLPFLSSSFLFSSLLLPLSFFTPFPQTLPFSVSILGNFPQSEEFSVYMYYTENYMDAVMNLESILKDPDAVDYLKVFK